MLWSTSFGFGRGSAKTKHVLVYPKAFTKTCFFTAFLQCCWGCLYSKTLFKSICLTTSPTLAQHCLIIQLKMSSINSIKNEFYVTPRRIVLPSSLYQSAGPACHSLSRWLFPLWVYWFRQICPLLFCSQAESMLAYLSWYVVWWTRYVAFFNVRQWSRPVIPSLGAYFPCGSIDLGKYVLSSALVCRSVDKICCLY